MVDVFGQALKNHQLVEEERKRGKRRINFFNATFKGGSHKKKFPIIKKYVLTQQLSSAS